MEGRSCKGSGWIQRDMEIEMHDVKDAKNK